jgi:putative glutathione S-transferase
MLAGWRFPTAEDTDAAGENVVPDPVPGHEGFTHLRDLYFGVNPSYEGRFTVPVLYDKKTQTIVNNESSEILRMFGTEVGSYFISFLPMAIWLTRGSSTT